MSPPLPGPDAGFENGRQVSGNLANSTNPSDRLVLELRQGLERIIAAVRNYTIAFEALFGMRGESFLFHWFLDSWILGRDRG